MKTSDIITSQFVSLTQTPAGVAERLVARIIDYIVIGVYFFGLWTAFDKYNWLLDPLGLGDSLFRVLYILLLLSPILCYSVICEFFLDGRTLGKMIMKTRVVMVDGSAPTLGAILLRWLFLLIDVYLMNIGIIAIICTRRNQRLGDLAAGTMVIRTPRTDQMHFTLSELSLGQIDVVNHILDDQVVYSDEQVEQLANKIERMLDIKREPGMDATDLLRTVAHDYQHFALQVI